MYYKKATAKWLSKRGADVGQKIASVITKWAEREEELDNMMRTWEDSLELPMEEDQQQPSGWIEKVSTLPPSEASGEGSNVSTPTAPKDLNPTDPEAGSYVSQVEYPEPTRTRSREVYPTRMLPAIPEDDESQHQPAEAEADAEERRMDGDEESPEHVLGGRWRKVADESKRLFDRRKENEYYSLQPELRREVLRCHRHLGHMPKEQLARVLADAGAKFEVIDWTRKHFECPVCKSMIKPGLPRRAAARKSYQFNKTVGADHFSHNFAAKPFD